MSAHTPGPWYVNDHIRDEECLYIEAPSAAVASIFVDPYFTDKDTANARLIAAAPDLLRALKDINAAHSGLAKSCGHEYECVCTMDAARHAIAKAEGRTL